MLEGPFWGVAAHRGRARENGSAERRGRAKSGAKSGVGRFRCGERARGNENKDEQCEYASGRGHVGNGAGRSLPFAFDDLPLTYIDLRCLGSGCIRLVMSAMQGGGHDIDGECEN